MDGTAIVIQARMGSTRLPGKTLMTLGSRTVLEHCLLRLDESGLPLIVATTDRVEDDAVDQEARRCGVPVFRGDSENVLARYIATARAFGLSSIVRATADNPLVDIDGPRRVVELARNVGADHVVECGLPVGSAVEIVSVDALERAQALISDPYDREHVTSFIRRDARFRSLRALAPRVLRRPGLRLTVDTQDDLDFIRNVLGAFDTHDPMLPLAVVIPTADALLVRTVVRERLQRGA